MASEKIDTITHDRKGTPERMGGPLIRELIDCIILQS